MNFTNWFVKNKEKDQPKKDFSNVGIDNTKFNWDVFAAEMGVFPTFIGTSQVGGFGNTYGGYFSYQGGSGTYPLYGMHSLVRMYRWMSSDADIKWGVDEIVNEMTITDREDEIVELNLDKIDVSDNIKDKIKEEFSEILNLMDFKNTAHFHTSNFYIDGRCFYKLDIDKNNIQKGIQHIKLLSPFDVVGYFDKNYGTMTPEAQDQLAMGSGYILTENAYRNSQFLGLTRHTPSRTVTEYIAVPEDLIVYQHSGIVDWRYNIPVSYLQFVLKTLNQLRTMKDAMVIYRMTRAPERFIFNIEVGKMQHAKAEQYVRRVADRLKETIQYDPETGAFKDNNDKLAMYKDWYFPKVMGEGTTVDTIQAGTMTGQIEEIEYIQKVLMRQMYIPFSRYFQESSMRFGSDDGEIERSEIKFYKHIYKLQIQYNFVFFDLLKKQLSFKNIISEDEFNEFKTSIEFVWGTQNLYKETKETALLKRIGAAMSEFDAHEGKYVSREWIYKNLFNLDDEEIKEMDKQMSEELAVSSYREQVKNGDIRFDSDGNEMIEDKEADEWITKDEMKKRKAKPPEEEKDKKDEKDIPNSLRDKKETKIETKRPEENKDEV